MPIFSAGNSKKQSAGFSLIELLLALTIAGLVMAAAFPASKALMSSMQYQSAVRDVASRLMAARLRAVRSGQFQDVIIKPQEHVLLAGGKTLVLPAALGYSVTSARELNRRGAGVIRFYPDGGSSGGDIELRRASGAGSVVSVDWLLGRVRVQKIADEV